MKKTKLVSWLLVVLFLGTIFVGGCGQTAPEYQPVELNFATWQPPTYPNNTLIFEPFAEAVEERTEGRVKIYLQPGGVLAKGDETYDAVVTGMIDMGFSLQSYTPGRFPLSTILEFPFMFTSSLQACQVAAELFKTNTAFQKEYDDVKVVWIGTTDTSVLISGKPVEKIDDFKGMRIRTPGPVQNDMATAFGATPVSMPYAEVYDAIQRGIVDATFGPQTSIFPFNFHEVAQNIVKVDFYSTPLYVVMNKSVWEKISPEDQAVITELMDEIPKNMGELYNKRVIGVKDELVAKNLNVITFSDEEMQKARNILEPLEDKWLADMEAKGLPAREFYDQVKALAEKYK
ncbi:MAG: TRAP transporter substrate-binding protein [Bacillota bacterium]|nr:TRAP transporter substrate-binding protein [Bacillota bacterium]